MTAPTIEIFTGLSEELSNVRLRRNRATGVYSITLSFPRLNALQGTTSFTRRSFNHLRLSDEEGSLDVYPNSTKMVWGGEDGDELVRFDFIFELTDTAHWDRFLRFMNRYAEANQMQFNSASTPQKIE